MIHTVSLTLYVAYSHRLTLKGFLIGRVNGFALPARTFTIYSVACCGASRLGATVIRCAEDLEATAAGGIMLDHIKEDMEGILKRYPDIVDHPKNQRCAPAE